MASGGPRYAELFAGAGGLSRGLDMAGWEPLAHAEIEPHARAILRKHWPDTRLDGDVSTLNGADYKGITLLSGGSPCQDLSIAGKRGGMTEGSGTRSSLYFEQIRIWQESEAPYLLWENVLGALSSNAGRDFAAVLSALVGASVPVPDDGWRGAGVASGPAGVAAWRILDAQFFGVPQRRRRVFVLCARAGGVDPAEVLALSESVSGDSQASRTAGEGTAGGAAGGADGPREVAHTLTGEGCDASEDGTGRWTPIVAQTLRVGGREQGAGDSYDNTPVVVQAFGINNDSRAETIAEMSAPLRSGARQQPAVLAFDTTQITSPGNYSKPKPGDPCHPLAAAARAPVVLAFKTDQEPEISGGNGIIGTLDTGSPTGGGHIPAVLVLASCQANAEITEGVSPGVPRRLTPMECERLQGWPETEKAVRFHVCGENQKNPAPAGGQNLRSLESASPVVVIESIASALRAEPTSPNVRADHANAVAWRVEIGCETHRVTISNGQREWSWSARTADTPEWCARLVKDALTARANVEWPIIAARIARRGAEGEQPSVTVSAHPESGSALATVPGAEIAESVSDALSDQERGRSTTSEAGKSFPTYDSPLQTLCSSAALVICGFIPEPTSDGTSFDCEVVLRNGWTFFGINEDGAEYALSDTARYRLVGNGIAAPVAAWIGFRLAGAIREA